MSEKKIITDEIPEEVQEQLENFPVKIEAKSSHGIQIRFILAAMGFWCFFVLASLRVNLSLGIVAMVNWTGIKEDMNTSESAECRYPKRINKTYSEDGPFLWDTHIQGHILSCYFYGLASTQLMGGRVAELVSAKYVLLIGTLLATLTNLVVPPVAIYGGAYGLMALQVFKGFGQGIVMPAFSVLMGKWVPPVERARFMSVIASGLPVGSFFTVVISGILCKTPAFGWPYVFYIFGIVALLWCVFWGILIYDSPLTHPYITKEELNRIMTVRSQKAPDVIDVKIPLKNILTSRPVWAYICAGFASFWALCLYASVIPMFLGTVLKYDIETNGLMSAMPNIAEAFFLLLTSVLSDRLLGKGVVTATTIRKTCIGTGLIGFSVCMVLVSVSGCRRIPTVLLLVLALGLSGFSFSSTALVPVDMAPRFAGTISGIMNTFGALSGIIIPTLVGYLTRDAQTMREWSKVFYSSALICLLGAIIFISFGSSEMQDWNNPPDNEEESSQEPLEKGPKAKSEDQTSEEDGSGPPSSTSKEDEERPWRDESFPELRPETKPSITLRL